mgnify:CR=1 FL=1
MTPRTKERCERCGYYAKPSDAPETVEKDCMWIPSEDEEQRPCDEMTLETKRDIMNDLLGKWPELIKFLEAAGFYDWPAAKNHHGACWGGLFDHSLQVTYELMRLTEKLNLSWKRKESPAIIGMLHDVCKLDDYSVLPFGDEKDKPGIEWNKDAIYPGHGEKSLMILMGHIELTEEEKMCIRYHMGAFTDSKEWPYYSRAVKNYPNVLYTHTADMIASQVKGI